MVVSVAASETPGRSGRLVEEAFRPRWVVWGSDRPSRCSSTAECGCQVVGHRRGPAPVGWRLAHGSGPSMGTAARLERLTICRSLPLSTCSPNPTTASPTKPLRADGYLKPEWLAHDFEWTTSTACPMGAAGRRGCDRCKQARLAALDDRPKARIDCALRVRRRTVVRGALVRRPADGPRRGRVARRLVRRSAPEQPRRKRPSSARATRRGRAASLTERQLRPAQSRAGEIAAARHRCRTARHARLAARGDPRNAPADRCAAGMAQGRADRDDLRLRLARRAPRRRRSAARRRGRRAMVPPAG